VTLAYNSRVQIIGGAHAGHEGWLVALTPAPDPLYTVELASGDGEAEVPQSLLRSAT
jgi:hypothetical protein